MNASSNAVAQGFSGRRWLGAVCCAFAASAVAQGVTVGFTDPSATGTATFSTAAGAPLNLGSFGITINAGPTLASNAAAQAAFQRAAQQWMNFIADPVTISINADLANLGNPLVIGSTLPVLLSGGYTLVRDQVVVDAADEAGDGIVASLPTAGQFTATVKSGTTLSGLMVATKANLKALGFTGLDSIAGVSDGTITFNSGFAFDYDRSDGIAPGLIDFETVAAHEIGHVLGLLSAVDDADQGTTSLGIDPWDLFRFPAAQLPSTPADFTTFPRLLAPAVAGAFTDLDMTGAVSTGANLGDGRQASHWKDDGLTGTKLGLMDPTLGAQEVVPLSALDLRVLDLIGYEIDMTLVPEAVPSAWACAALLAAAFWWRRR